MVAFYVPIGLMGAAKPPVLTFEDSNIVGPSTGSHTHTLSCGPADPTRALIALLTYVSGGSNAITINGISAATAVSVVSSGAIYQMVIARVPTGTTASVVIPSQGGNNYLSYCGLYSATNLISLTPLDTDTDTNNPASMSLSVPALAVAVAMMGEAGGSPTGITWTGVTKDYQNISSGSSIQSGGSFTATSSTTLSIGATISTSGGLFPPGAVSASFR